MSEINTAKAFIGYEYKEISCTIEKASMMMDCYESFGWEIDENVMGNQELGLGERGYSSYNRHMTIRMKRNRKLMNKMELTRLQRNFEACIREIEALEKSKTSKASTWALVIGILGTVFMAGSVFAVTAQPPYILLCVVLAVPAFLGWFLPYFMYQKIKREQTEKVTPYIDAKYDEIYEICEKGSKLLDLRRG